MAKLSSDNSRVLMLLMGIAVALPSDAQAGDVAEVDVGGSLFAHWGYNMKPTPYEGYVDGDPRPNAFDIDRAFLDVTAKLDETFSIKARTDVARDDGGKLALFMRNAYLQVALEEGVKLRFGAAENTMNHLSAQFWDQRWLAEPFASENDANHVADLGVYALGNHADGLLSWGAAVVNGEGYQSMDTDHDKAFQGRITVDPLHGDMKLPISVYMSKDFYTHNEVDGHTVLIAAIGFDQEYANVWGEYVSDSAGDLKAGGMSFSVVGKVPDLFNLIGRYDTWDPDKGVDGDEHNTIRSGVTKDFTETISAGIMYEQKKFKADPDQPHKGVYFRMQAGF